MQLVELKNGETFNGHLVNCDNFMNITLREVYQTNADGDRFWKVKECYIRGSTVRPLCAIPVRQLTFTFVAYADKVPARAGYATRCRERGADACTRGGEECSRIAHQRTWQQRWVSFCPVS